MMQILIPTGSGNVRVGIEDLRRFVRLQDELIENVEIIFLAVKYDLL